MVITDMFVTVIIQVMLIIAVNDGDNWHVCYSDNTSNADNNGRLIADYSMAIGGIREYQVQTRFCSNYAKL